MQHQQRDYPTVMQVNINIVVMCFSFYFLGFTWQYNNNINVVLSLLLCSFNTLCVWAVFLNKPRYVHPLIKPYFSAGFPSFRHRSHINIQSVRHCLYYSYILIVYIAYFIWGIVESTDVSD